MSAPFSDTIAFRVDPRIYQMVAEAAAKRGTKSADWLRRTIETGLQLDGFDLTAVAARDAGTLYDVSEGKRRYALVSPGSPKPIVYISVYLDAKPEIADVNYHPARYVPTEGDAWVPVVHEDSEPLDPALHFRLKPHYTLVTEYATPQRVVCTYPVVPKSMEWM